MSALRPFETTLAAIRKHGPCPDGWDKLLKHLGVSHADAKTDQTPLDILTILESNGIDDALWCLRACEGIDRECRLFAVWCARQVQHLMTDQRSREALDVVERHANGLASDAELETARAAAGAAARAAAWTAAGAAQTARLVEVITEARGAA